MDFQNIKVGDYVELVPNLFLHNHLYKIVDIGLDSITILIEEKPVYLSVCFVSNVYRKIEG
jgi:hypothetical protein